MTFQEEYKEIIQRLATYVYIASVETDRNARKIVRSDIAKDVSTVIQANKGKLEEMYDNFKAEVQEKGKRSNLKAQK